MPGFQSSFLLGLFSESSCSPHKGWPRCTAGPSITLTGCARGPEGPSGLRTRPSRRPTSTTAHRGTSPRVLAKQSFLPCKVRHLGDRTVSWIRRRDLHVLTVGRFTYTSDQRFQAIHMDNSDLWMLQIQYPQKRDAGMYECQVSTLPKISRFIALNVIGEYAVHSPVHG
ncbi:hypothetical protein MRX96_029748 [Rhipicephalus microplus]